jgi:hypothetical protein
MFLTESQSDLLPNQGGCLWQKYGRCYAICHNLTIFMADAVAELWQMPCVCHFFIEILGMCGNMD